MVIVLLIYVLLLYLNGTLIKAIIGTISSDAHPLQLLKLHHFEL